MGQHSLLWLQHEWRVFFIDTRLECFMLFRINSVKLEILADSSASMTGNGIVAFSSVIPRAILLLDVRLTHLL
jgi:hypothetical protein